MQEATGTQDAFPLCDRLRYARQRIGLTQETFGGLIGKTKNNISQYERSARKPDYKTLRAYAHHCHVSADYLLGLTDLIIPIYQCQGKETPLAGTTFHYQMQGDTMSNQRVFHGDLLTLMPTHHASSGDMVLVCKQGKQSIMIMTQHHGKQYFYPDSRSLSMLSQDGITILAVVIRAEITPNRHVVPRMES